MTKNQLLNALLADLAGMTGQATNEQDAKILGGYRFVNVDIDNGVHYGAFGGNGREGRLNAKMMELKLRSLIDGLEYARTTQLYAQR